MDDDFSVSSVFAKQLDSADAPSDFNSDYFSKIAELDVMEEFDPLADNELDLDDEDQEGPVELIGARDTAQRFTPAAEYATTAEKRQSLAELLQAMAPQRRSLYGILSFCLSPQPAQQVESQVQRLQEHNFSVFNAADLTNLLERSGGIRRVGADGGSYIAKAEPQVVMENGVEYLRPAQPAEVFWLTTEDGQAALEGDKPLERMQELFASDSRYLPIYQRILKLCERPGGVSAKELGVHVDEDQLVQKPRLYAPRFVDRLEKCDALIWRKNWLTTEVGRQGLELLVEVEDCYEPPSSEELAAKMTSPPAAAGNVPGSVQTARREAEDE